jgi:asparagine synthase (glutamine-hydrolysing)
MCRELAHRGPDAHGVAMGRRWGLGHRRLSIIDLSDAGRQPMPNETASCHVVCNGEVYNYRLLRNQLLKNGHHFRSRSDSEVLVHLFEDCSNPVDALPLLNGMYGFAVVNEASRRLILARDRLGIKPLYYALANGSLVFASEIKAIVRHPAVAARLNRPYFGEFIQHRDISGAETLFEGIHELLPGHFLNMDIDSMNYEVTPYWELDASGTGDAETGSLEACLQRSVERCMMSDVPLGTQLSGGLDSSLVTAMAAATRPEPMHTFTVSFVGSPDDEAPWADLVSRHIGTTHHVVPYTEHDFIRDLAPCTWFHDTPLNHANSLPMYQLCRVAKEHVTVLLTGEGADELMGGYSWHRRLWRFRQWWPLLRFVPRPVANALASGAGPRSIFLSLLGRSQRDIISHASEWVCDADLKKIVSAAWPGRTRFRDQLPLKSRSILGSVLELDLKTYLLTVLQRQDRMSMATAVESRVPFLDHEFVECARRLPDHACFIRGGGKACLRDVAMRWLPREVIERPKIGFRVPVGPWFRRGGGLHALTPWLTDDRATARKLWDPVTVKGMAAAHAAGRGNHADILWGLLSFELWARLWLDGIPVGTLQEALEKTVRSGTAP